MQYIKEALLNPLLIMENIMGIGFPNEEYPYLNTLYFTFIDLITALIPKFEYSAPVIDEILRRAKISDEILEKLSKTRMQLDGFMITTQLCKRDLLYTYVKLGMNVETGSQLEDMALRYRKLINCMDLQPDAIYAELRGQNMFYSDKALNDLAVWLTESVMTLAHNALNHNNNEKVGRIYMYNPERSNSTVTEFHTDEYGRSFFTIAEKDKIRTNVRAKPAQKEMRRELPKQVNKLDEEAGCDLKRPKKAVDTPHKFEVKVNKYKYALAKYLFKLNKTKLKKHLDENTIFGMEVQNIEINKKFRKMSPWFDKHEVDVDEAKFMFRFISYIFAWIIRHLSEIAEICYRVNKDNEEFEFESKMDYVKYTVKRAIALAEKIMDGLDIEDDLIYFESLMQCMESSPKTKKKVLKNINNLKDHVDLLSAEFKPFPNIKMYKQDVQMDTLVKLSYMVTTHDIKMKAGLEFHEGYRFRKVSETHDILVELGKAIHRSHKKVETPPMFRYFVASNPIVESQFDDVNDDQNLATGVMAMKYFAFLTNDHNVKERVESII